MLVKWNFTVCSVIQSSALIAWFARPRATAWRTSSSRSVSPARSSSCSVRVHGRQLEALAPIRPTQRVGKLAGVDRLREVDVGAARERLLRPLRLVRGGQHDDANVCTRLADPLDARQPVHLGHPDVQQAEIRLQLAQQREHLASSPSLADDLDVVGAPPRRAGPLSGSTDGRRPPTPGSACAPPSPRHSLPQVRAPFAAALAPTS